ncbi:unnamed protein product, partial [Laminaria digitata]
AAPRRNGNIAFAVGEVDGKKFDRAAASGWQAERPDIVGRYEGDAIFKVIKSGVLDSASHTEAKLLEHLARDLLESGKGPTDIKGSFVLFTERAPCRSCGGQRGRQESLISSGRCFPGLA